MTYAGGAAIGGDAPPLSLFVFSTIEDYKTQPSLVFLFLVMDGDSDSKLQSVTKRGRSKCKHQQHREVVVLENHQMDHLDLNHEDIIRFKDQN